MPKKKCEDDEILNPKTNRCVKKTGSIGKKLLNELKKKALLKKDCKEDEIRNPETNRCVKKSGTIGKRILENQRRSSKSTAKSRRSQRNRRNKSTAKSKRIYKICDDDKILNPKTNKCVKLKGQLGRNLLKKLEDLKEVIRDIIKSKDVDNVGDIKKILREREIPFEHYKLSDIIRSIFYNDLKEVIQELIDSGNYNTLREIKTELKKRNIDYDKDTVKNIVIEIME